MKYFLFFFIIPFYAFAFDFEQYIDNQILLWENHKEIHLREGGWENFDYFYILGRIDSYYQMQEDLLHDLGPSS